MDTGFINVECSAKLWAFLFCASEFLRPEVPFPRVQLAGVE